MIGPPYSGAGVHSVRPPDARRGRTKHLPRPVEAQTSAR